MNGNSSCSAGGMRSPNLFTAGGVDEGALCHRRGSLIGVIGVIEVIGVMGSVPITGETVITTGPEIPRE